MNKESEIIFKKPQATGGAYLDPEFIKSYWDLVISLSELIPDDRSHGALQLSGVGAMCRARCKAISDKAKIMENIMKAITYKR